MVDKEYKVIKLGEENYAVWKWQFINVLRAQKLESVIDPEGKATPADDAQALALLGSAYHNVLKIINCSNFDSAWKSIQTCFENRTAFQPQFLHQRLNSYRIQSASGVSSGVSEMRGIVAQLENLNEAVSDNALIGAISAAHPSSFNIFATVWKNSADQNVGGLISKLLAEATDQALQEKGDTKALAVRGKYKGKSEPRFNKDQCRYCKEEGHWIKDCPNLMFHSIQTGPRRARANSTRTTRKAMMIRPL